MPIKSKYEFTCTECNKKFKVVLSDAIMPDDAELFNSPICKKCKIKKDIKNFFKVGLKTKK